MARLMLVYLSGTEKGKTRIFTQDHLTIGTAETADLTLVPEEGGALPEGILADLYWEAGLFHIVPRDPLGHTEITVNGDSLAASEVATGRILSDGDTIHFGHGLSSASLLFQILPETFGATHPARIEGVGIEPLGTVPVQPPHPLTATLFVKELASSLWAEIPRRVKLMTMAAVVVVVGVTLAVVGYGFLTLHRVGVSNDVLRRKGDQEEARRQQDQDLIKDLNLELNRLRQQSDQSRLFAQNIAERYSPGVCLISGSYTFTEHGSGRVLRYESAEGASDSLVDQKGNLLASVDGAGPAVEMEFTGTGFLVEDGLLVTNKHVVQPWATDTSARVIMAQGQGFKPKLDTLEAFFPATRTPFQLKIARLSERYDIALCSFGQDKTALPSLPLGTGNNLNLTIGEPVVLLGYPTGVDGLLQRIDESERRAILSEHRRSVEDVAEGLAARGLVRPLTTDGIVTDSLPSRVVHSAHTTEGGSGGPLFDREYRVIAVNSAILASADGNSSFGGSNFGVPVSVVSQLLEAYRQEMGQKPFENK